MTSSDAEILSELRSIRNAIETLSGQLRARVSVGIEPDAIYKVADAAYLVSLHPETLREKLRIGIITGKRKAGGSYRIKGSELLKLA